MPKLGYTLSIIEKELSLDLWPEIDVIFEEELVECADSGCRSGSPPLPV